MYLLGGHRATEDEKETSRMLISSIPEKELGKLIANLGSGISSMM